MPLGDQVPRGDDDVVRRIGKLESLYNQVIALAGSASAIAAAVQTGLGNLASSGTTWAGPVSTGGTVAAGNVSASNVTGGNVFAQSVSTIITAGRVAVWGRTSDGYLATASSSERFKDNITPVNVDSIADAMLEVVVSYFQYKAELRMRDDPSDPNYIGPEYHVGTNIGAIAERMHELGLWEFVVYERDDNGNLVLGDDGQPVADGIHDILIGWGVLLLSQRQQIQIDAEKARNDKFATRLHALDGLSEN